VLAEIIAHYEVVEELIIWLHVTLVNTINNLLIVGALRSAQ